MSNSPFQQNQPARDENLPVQMNPQELKADMLKRLSRRNWLRNAAIAATGTVLLPSFLVGCTKEQWDQVTGGLGGTPATTITEADLVAAAANLKRMKNWIEKLYPYCLSYQETVYKILNGGTKPHDWTDFIINIFTEIGAGILEALEFPFAAPTLAVTVDFIKQWDLGEETPDNLTSTFTDFAEGHNQMQFAITQKLTRLASSADDYKNLRAAWEDPIKFNGVSYTLKDLATSNFPDEDANGDPWADMRYAAYVRFQKYLWELMIIKCGQMKSHSSYWKIRHDRTVAGYAEEWYSETQNRSRYLRGGYTKWDDHWYFSYWYFMIGDHELSSDAAKYLFEDYSPGDLKKPKGLWPRDYVFKQFNREKQNFGEPDPLGYKYTGYHDLTSDLHYHDDGYADFDYAKDTYTFTGGDFPELTKP